MGHDFGVPHPHPHSHRDLDVPTLALSLLALTVLTTKLLSALISRHPKFKDTDSRLFNSLSNTYLSYLFWGFFLGWIMWGKH